jgi:hypothetical protein
LVEQRGLAGAGRTEEHDEFAGVQIKVDAVESANLGSAIAVNLGQSADMKYLVATVGSGGRAGIVSVGRIHSGKEFRPSRYR